MNWKELNEYLGIVQRYASLILAIKVSPYRLTLFIILMITYSNFTYSHNGLLYKIVNIDVSGVITDEEGEPLIGVNILVKGTNKGISTDFEGRFTLEDVDENDVLVVSYVGYQTQEVSVAGKSSLSITMVLDSQLMDEVVVVGYGTMKKSDLTGSVARVDVEKLEEIPNVSVVQAMQGTVAGLNVGAVDQAGENPSLSIRGQNTLSSSSGANAPLIVVDGSIYRGSLVDLNTADIASVDILKDASSAAIYGSQASNGVMLITTKKGSETDKPIIGYSGSFTLQTPSNKLEPMNSAELTEFFPDVLWASGARLAPDYLQPDPTFSISNHLKTNEIITGFQNGQDTDWWGAFTGNGHNNTHNLNIRGKTNTIGYFVSGGITDVQGFIKNDKYKRYNFRMNFDANINDWLSLGIESFLTQSDYSGVSPSQSVIFYMQPWAPVYDESGEFIVTPEGSWLNPYLQLQQDDSDKRLNLFANAHLDVNLPVEGLTYKLNYSQNYRNRNADRFDPWGAGFTGSGHKNTYQNYDWSADNILSYNRSISDVHNINATLVYGVEKLRNSFTEAGAQNFIDGLLGYNRLEAGDPTLRSLNTGKQGEQSLYSMARLAYNYDSRYLITGTIRRDGFSGFGTEDKIAVFPSLAVGWVISEESFFQNSLRWFDYLKLRGSYGQTGRRGVGRYDTRAIVNAHPSIIFGDGGSATQGQWISSLANNQLGWETTTGINIGADFNIWNSRLYGNIEYYNNKTEDILYAIQLPSITGFSSVNTNIGEVANHGIEVTLSSQVLQSGPFGWEASINYSRNRNKIVSILGFDNDNDGREDDLVANRLFIGEPQRVIYDYDITGMWQLSDDESSTIPDGFFPGTYKLADLNGDGAFSASDDKKILGYQDPAYRIGVANTLTYNNFRLYVFVNSIQGGKDYYYALDQPFIYQQDQLTYSNVPKGAWDYWMPDNPGAYFRRLDTPSQYRPNRYAQRNFVRLQDVSLSYTFDSPFISKYMNNLKVFVSGKNLATITDWRGWDPETGVGFSTGRPLMTNYTVGINVEF